MLDERDRLFTFQTGTIAVEIFQRSLVQSYELTGRNLERWRQEGHDVHPDERTARVKGNERPLPPPPLLLHPALHLTDVV